MISLTEEPCESADTLCEYVLELTGSNELAQASNWLIAKPLAIGVLLISGLLARWILHRIIEKLAHQAGNGMRLGALAQGKLSRSGRQGPVTPEVSARRLQRTKTVASVLKSIASFVIFAIITVMVFAELGYNVGPLITGAGVIGLALGFGAQSLVKDFLSGIFLYLEDQLGVGDRVEINEVVGTVEAVTLRVVRIRTDDDTVWYVRNGEILKVGNHSQG